MGNTMALSPQAAAIVTKTTPSTMPAVVETGIFAAGCFWGVELAYQRIPGVLETAVGYTDGHKKDPTYQEVCSGSTGHTEAVQVKFDKNIVAYKELLTIFWDRVDPTTLNRQGNDRGTQYRSGIYYTTPEQKTIAEESLAETQTKYDKPIVTEIKEASQFYMAEDYHQQYLEKGGQCARKGDTSRIRCYG